MDKKWANFFYVKLSFLVVLIECIYIYHQQLTESNNVAPGAGPSNLTLNFSVSTYNYILTLHTKTYCKIWFTDAYCNI